MKKVVLCAVILIIVFSISCQNHKKSIYDLERESVASGIYNDTLFGNITLGLTESDVYKILKMRRGENYFFPIENFEDLGFEVYPNFFNDSLCGVKFHLWNKGYKFSDIVNVYTLKYGQSDTTFIEKDRDSERTYYYWFNGNIEINLLKLETKNWTSIYIEYEDLSRTYIKKGIHTEEKKGSTYYFSDDYYNSIFLPRKQEELKGI